MQSPKVYEVLADYFVAEEVDTFFGLMGDGNMHWMIALGEKPGVSAVSVRHEHCALGMAMGYYSATGKVGVASVTCGPGYTQIMTALATAVQADIPMIIFTGETPMNAKWHNQSGIDQAGLARACGAEYISVHAPEQIANMTQQAFFRARTRKKPVVLALPYDMQKLPTPAIASYLPSKALIPPNRVKVPDAEEHFAVARALAEARMPLIIGGRGVIEAGAETQVRALADRCGAALATTLLGKGLFDDHPFCLGISGGYAGRLLATVANDVDFVLGIGASLSHYTMMGETLFPKAKIVQLDVSPVGMKDGRRVADHYIEADAKLGTEALLAALDGLTPKSQLRTAVLQRSIVEGLQDETLFEITDGCLDPRDFFAVLEKVLPSDYDLVSGSAHQAYWHTTMRGRSAGHYHAARAFGAVGNGISYAAGVAAARNGSVVLFEGDGGLMMHLQELETLARHGIKMLIVCCNDGAYGAETHRLRAEGLNAEIGEFGRPDFAAIARAMGIRGRTVTSVDGVGDWLDEYQKGKTAEIWDVHVSAQVMTGRMQMEVAELLVHGTHGEHSSYFGGAGG